MSGTFKGECYRTAEMLVDITETQVIYYAIAFLYDSGYDLDRLKILLPILEKTKGTTKKGE